MHTEFRERSSSRFRVVQQSSLKRGGLLTEDPLELVENFANLAHLPTPLNVHGKFRERRPSDG